VNKVMIVQVWHTSGSLRSIIIRLETVYLWGSSYSTTGTIVV